MSYSRRAPARKVLINDLLKGEFETQQDGSKVLHIKTGDEVRRARIMGTIEDKIIDETEESVITNIVDETGTIRVKAGGTAWGGEAYLEMKGMKEGATVDVIGLLREGPDGAMYIQAELCIPVVDKAYKVLRDLEISKYYAEAGLQNKATEHIETAIKGQANLEEKNEIKDQILEILKNPENRNEGCSFEELKKQLGLSTSEIEPALRELQNDGDIFEPMPGTFKFV
ncbi:MAG: hypothetical protein U9O98_01310 [Asgard group archaeon]|nr:hypothetical protein [Asgard group archaeon]